MPRSSRNESNINREPRPEGDGMAEVAEMTGDQSITVYPGYIILNSGYFNSNPGRPRPDAGMTVPEISRNPPPEPLEPSAS